MTQSPELDHPHPGSALAAAHAAIDDRTQADDSATFLLDLAGAMHTLALPSDVIEGLIERAARRLGLHADLMVVQGYLTIDVSVGSAQRTRLRRVSFDTHWRLERMADVYAIADELGDGRIGVSEARARLQAVTSRPPKYAKPIVVLGYTVYGIAVAARVGGSVNDLLAAAVVGFVAGVVHFGTLQYPRVDLQKSALGGAAGALTVLCLSLVIPDLDLAKALFGGVSLLVPAMVIVIGTHELANEALESGVVRLAYGLLRFVMLAVGIAAALHVWNLFAVVPHTHHEAGLPIPVVLAILVAGGLALIPCLQLRRRDALPVVLAVLAAHGTMVLSKLVFGEQGAPLAAAFVLGTLAQLYGRLPGHFAGTVMIPGLLQIAPGFLGTTAVLNMLGGKSQASFFPVMMVTMQLLIGLVLANVLFGRKRHA